MEDVRKQLDDILSEYQNNVTNTVDNIADHVAEETAKELKTNSPKRTGKYAKGWTYKTAGEYTLSKTYTVHNKSKYQLTHLLEKGHVGRNGKRVKAVPHIEQVERKAIKKMEERLIREL